MPRLQANCAAFSRLIAFFAPLLLALHWPAIAIRANVEIILLLLRLGLLGSALALTLIWAGTGLTKSEMKWSFLLGIYLTAYFCVSLTGTNVTRGFQDCVRIGSAMFAGFGLTRALRHEPSARAFGISCLFGSLISCGLILAEYHHYMGYRIPDYESLRIFKESVLRGAGVALNPLASASFLFCLLGMCILPLTAPVALIGFFVLLVVATLTGSRAPLALLILGSSILLLLNALRSRHLIGRVAGWLILLAGLAATPILVSRMSVTKLSSVTEGRYDVWTVAWAKFLESPLVGHGPESWKDDLFSRLPGYYKQTGALQRLKAGGYHSEYMTLLAEGGLLCCVPAMILLSLLLADATRIAWGRGACVYRRQFVIFTCLFLCVRASIELPGLFGYGQDAIDYLAYMFVALVASQRELSKSSDFCAHIDHEEALTQRADLALSN